MRGVFSSVALAVAVLAAAGCGGSAGGTTAEHRGNKSPGETSESTTSGSSDETTYLTVTLAGRQGPEDAGIETAYHRGYTKEPRVLVGVASPLTPLRPIRYVVDGTDTIGVSHLPQVALAVEKGAPIVAIGSLIPRPAATLIWLRRSGIHGVADLKGKTIAIPGLSFQRGMLEAILRRAGVSPRDVKIVKVRYGLAPSLISGRADATFGGYGYAEGIELEARGLAPVVTPVTSLGVPAYEELVWIARTDFAAEHAKAIRHFIAAIRRGTVAAAKQPLAAAELIGESPEAELLLSPSEMAAGVEAAAPLLSRSGRMSLARANRLLAWMHAKGLIRRQMPASALLTNRYLP